MTFPDRLVAEFRATEPDRAVEIGIRWALEQTIELFEQGVPSVRFSLM